MNGFYDWLVNLPTWAIAAIVISVLAAVVAAGLRVAAKVIDDEPGPQRALVPAPPPEAAQPSLTPVSPYADVFFPTSDSTDEFRAVGTEPRYGSRRVNGSRRAIVEDASPWPAASDPDSLN